MFNLTVLRYKAKTENTVNSQQFQTGLSFLSTLQEGLSSSQNHHSWLRFLWKPQSNGTRQLLHLKS